MGKIFTTEQLENGDYAAPGAHYEAGRYLLGQFFTIIEPLEEGEAPTVAMNQDPTLIDHPVESAMVYGSTAMGTANRRSDLDILVNFHDYGRSLDDPGDAFGIVGKAFKETAERFKVPIEANVLPALALSRPLEHNIDPLFAQHLIAIQEEKGLEWSFNFPADGLAHDSSSRILLPEDDPNQTTEERAKNEQRVRAFAIRYASGKARQMIRALTAPDCELDLKAMQRALELPAALGRKVVALSKLANHDDSQQLFLFSNSDARESSFQDFIQASSSILWPGTEDMVSDVADLHAKDGEYSELVESVIAGNSSPSDHEAWLRSEYKPALHAAYDIGKNWTRLFRDRLDARDHKEESIALETIMAAATDSTY